MKNYTYYIIAVLFLVAFVITFNYGGCGGAAGGVGSSVPAAPNAASSLTATAISPTQINLSWQDNSTNEDGFKIERKTGVGDAYIQIITCPVSSTYYSDTGLSASVTYYYRIRAYNANGNSAYSNEASVITFPNVPSNLVATATSSSQINLTWQDTSLNKTGFIIEYAYDIEIEGGWSKSNYTQLVTVPADTISYSHTGLTSATEYDYRVKACNDTGESDCISASARTLPVAPVNLSVTVLSHKEIRLEWTNVSLNYNVAVSVERSINGITYTPCGGISITGTDDTHTDFTDEHLDGSTDYYYRLRTFTSSDVSVDFSNVALATTLPLSIGEAINQVNDLSQNNLITSPTVYNYLINHLNLALNCYASGEYDNAIGRLYMARDEVFAETGQSIDEQKGEELWAYLGDIIMSDVSLSSDPNQAAKDKIADDVDQNKKKVDDKNLAQGDTIKGTLDGISKAAMALINRVGVPPTDRDGEKISVIDAWATNKMSQAMSGTDTCLPGYSCDYWVDGNKNIGPDPNTGAIEIPKDRWLNQGGRPDNPINIQVTGAGPLSSTLHAKVNATSCCEKEKKQPKITPKPKEKTGGGIIPDEPGTHNNETNGRVILDFSEVGVDGYPVGRVCDLFYLKIEIEERKPNQTVYKTIYGMKLVIHLTD